MNGSLPTELQKINCRIDNIPVLGQIKKASSCTHFQIRHETNLELVNIHLNHRMGRLKATIT